MGFVEKNTEQKRLLLCRATPGKLTGTAALVSLPGSRLRILISVEKKTADSSTFSLLHACCFHATEHIETAHKSWTFFAVSTHFYSAFESCLLLFYLLPFILLLTVVAAMLNCLPQITSFQRISLKREREGEERGRSCLNTLLFLFFSILKSCQ